MVGSDCAQFEWIVENKGGIVGRTTVLANLHHQIIKVRHGKRREAIIASFKELVVADLRRVQRLIERVGGEINPQFRIASAEGDYWIGLALPDDEVERARRMALVSDFMALKCSPAFVLATEMKEPDAIVVVGVTHAERIGVISRITREPLTFAREEWLDKEALGNEISDLLPHGAREFSKERIAEIEAFFGDNGECPAVKIDKRFASGARAIFSG
jgi:hypothetical protein